MFLNLKLILFESLEVFRPLYIFLTLILVITEYYFEAQLESILDNRVLDFHDLVELV